MHKLKALDNSHSLDWTVDPGPFHPTLCRFKRVRCASPAQRTRSLTKCLLLSLLVASLGLVWQRDFKIACKC